MNIEIKIDKRLTYIGKEKFLTKNSNTILGYFYVINNDNFIDSFHPFVNIYKNYKDSFYFYREKEKKNKYKCLSKLDGKSMYTFVDNFIVFKKEDLINDRPIYRRNN